jgi:dTDP-glucose 4,6-dehydratase
LLGYGQDVKSPAPDIWPSLASARVFVTGGTGFFGYWLLEEFRQAQKNQGLATELVLLTRDPEAFARRHPSLAAIPGVSFCAGDVRRFASPPGEFTHVIHAATAASAQLNADHPGEMLDAIVGGTRRVLEFAAEKCVRRMLFTSSGAVYGPQPAALTHVPEDYSGPVEQPPSAYAEGKRQAEALCAETTRARPELEIAVGRFFAFVGPHLPLDTHFAIGNFIRDALAGSPIRIGGDGTPYRSYLYGSDLGTALWTLLARAPSLRPYNIGSEKRISIAELARLVSRVVEPLTGRSAEVVIAREPVPGAAPAQYVPSTQRAQSELGLRLTVPLEDAIRATAEWALARG